VIVNAGFKFSGNKIYECEPSLLEVEFLLSLWRAWSIALFVPALPAQPFLPSQLTKRGVKAAVIPTRNGNNKVLWMVYASNSIAYKLSRPEPGCSGEAGSGDEE